MVNGHTASTKESDVPIPLQGLHLHNNESTMCAHMALVKNTLGLKACQESGLRAKSIG